MIEAQILKRHAHGPGDLRSLAAFHLHSQTQPSSRKIEIEFSATPGGPEIGLIGMYKPQYLLNNNPAQDAPRRG